MNIIVNIPSLHFTNLDAAVTVGRVLGQFRDSKSSHPPIRGLDLFIIVDLEVSCGVNPVP